MTTLYGTQTDEGTGQQTIIYAYRSRVLFIVFPRETYNMAPTRIAFEIAQKRIVPLFVYGSLVGV